MKYKKGIIFFLATAVVIFLGFKYVEKMKAQNTLTYFYGQECDNCNSTEDALDKKMEAGKITLIKKEVWHDTDNAKEWRKMAQECGFGDKPLGVPFLSIDGKCYMGTGEVLDFLKNEYEL